MSATTLTGIVLDLPENEYHARPELSSTGARLLLDSPARFHHAQSHPQPHKSVFDIGTVVHSKVLGTPLAVAVIPEDILASNGAISTKEAKEFVAEARENGLIPLKRAEFEPINGAAESVLAHKGAAQLFAQPADAEVSVFATDPETGVETRGRFDFLPTDFTLGAPSRVAVDLKTARDASPKGFTKAIAEHGYDVQGVWYPDILHWLTGEEAELVFVAVEKEAPYMVGVYQLPTIWKEMGRTKARKARRDYAACMESGVWPGYGDQVHLLSPPTWLIYEHEERYGNE